MRRSVLRPRAGLATAALLATLLLAAGSAPAQHAAEGKPVEVRVQSPAPGQTVRQHVHQARVTGLAEAAVEGPRFFDVMLAIDVPTRGPADGVFGDGDEDRPLIEPS